MIRRKEEKIGDAIRFAIKGTIIEKKLNEVRLLNYWERKIAGNIGKFVRSSSIRDNVLYISLSSSVLRNELMLSRKPLIKELNQSVGAIVITDIRLL